MGRFLKSLCAFQTMREHGVKNTGGGSVVAKKIRESTAKGAAIE